MSVFWKYTFFWRVTGSRKLESQGGRPSGFAQDRAGLGAESPMSGEPLGPRQLGPVDYPMSRSGGRGRRGTGALAPVSGCLLVPSIWLLNLPTTKVHGKLN